MTADRLVSPQFFGIRPQDIAFDGNLSSWWTNIVTGFLLFAFIALLQILLRPAKRPVALTAGGVP